MAVIEVRVPDLGSFKDVSVVDVRMPPTQRDEGLRAAIEARRLVPGTPVLVLSQYVERQYDYRVLGSVLAACVNAVSRTETG